MNDNILSEKAEKIFRNKYAVTKPDGTKEDWAEACWRVANAVAQAEKEYGKSGQDIIEVSKEYYRCLVNKLFIPGGRILANAGSPIKNNFNCFYFKVGDSRREIYGTLTKAADIFANGGGCGFQWSYVRESGADVKGTGGKASGPLSFMELYEVTGDVISQASRRKN